MNSMKLSKQAAFVLIMVIFFTSCKDHEKIDQKKVQISKIEYRIRSIRDKISKDEILISSQVLNKNTWAQYYSQAKDSAYAYIKDNPWACACINMFDREPIEILTDYLKLDNDDQRNILALAQAVLIIYYGGNEEHIDQVRSDIKDFNDRARKYASNVNEIENNINDAQNDINLQNTNLSSATAELNEVQNELQKLEDSGFF